MQPTRSISFSAGILGACVVAGVLGLRPLPAQEPAAKTSAAPRWIWAPGRAGDNDVCRFRRTLAFDEPVVKAKLRMTCDNEFEAWIDGTSVLRGDQWDRAYVADVGKRLGASSVLTVRAVNHGGPAGLIARVDVELQSGARVSVVTDARWQVTLADTDAGARWLLARDLGPADTAPWRDPFEPRVATPAAKLQTKPGYGVTLVRSAQEEEGSWISMAFGPRGELYLGVERGGILRLADPLHPTPEPLDLPPEIRNPHGLAWAFDALWVNVNGKRGGLFELRDVDGDGRFEGVRRVMAWNGSGEHGAHAVVPGPDGNLWVLNGNMTDLPAGVADDSPHRLYAEDVLLPRYDDPNGHAVGIRAPGSHVLRIARDGHRIDLWAAGMRNAYDLAFDRDGELYTFDSDMEWDVGLPWYRPIRVCHVVSGAEFGWRSGSAKWPVETFDSLPGLIDIGRGSPTGVTFWYDGQVSDTDDGALVLADWALGRILAVQVHAKPVRAETLVAGKPLNVTDVAVGADGALWFVTGGRDTQSGLYRLAATQPVASRRPAVASPDAARIAARRDLEALHNTPSPTAVDAAWPALASSDRELRQVARVALEHVPVDLWRARALSATEPATAMAALLALARAGVDDDLGSLVDRLETFVWRSLPRARQLEWLRVLSVAVARHGPLVGERRQRMLDALAVPAAGPLPSDDFGLDRERATVLVALDADDLVPVLLAALGKTSSQAEQIAFASLLGRTRRGWNAERAESYVAWALSARARMGGGNSFSGYLDAMLDATLAQIGDADLVARLQAEREAAKEPRDLATAPSTFVRAWTVADLQPRLAAVDVGRSFVGGQRALEIGQCFTCHRFAGKGGSIGPDLTGVSRRLDRRTLLESILEPSKVISDQYELVTFSLRDGSSKVGRVRSETASQLELVVDPVANKIETLAKADVLERAPSPVSAMPPGLVNSLTAEQILDLLAYLENDGDKSADAFK